MELNEVDVLEKAFGDLISELRNGTSEIKALACVNKVTGLLKPLDETFRCDLINEVPGVHAFEDVGMCVAITTMQKGVLDKDSILARLTDQEKIENFDFTEKKLKDMGHQDLIKEFKTVESVPTIKVTKIA